MPLPRPELGLVIQYEFLWANQYDRGEEAGAKRRPCVILLTRHTRYGDVFVTVAPITHSEPRKDDVAIPLPPRVQAHLGLDNEQSWVIVSEVNEFLWPGYDIYPLPRQPSRFDYGFVPPALHDRLVGGLMALAAESKGRIITRTDERRD